MDDHTPETRKCSKCKNAYPLTAEYFARAKKEKFGLDYWCRECRREHGRQCYWKNREKRLVQMRDYYSENRERLLPEIRARARNWYYANLEYAKAYRQEHYRRNRGVAIVRARIWAKANPERCLINARNSRVARRARMLAASGTYTDADVKAQFKSQNGLCWWCGKSVEAGYHADHRIPLSRGGSNAPENIVVSCPSCNRSKGAKLPQEWGNRLL